MPPPTNVNSFPFDGWMTATHPIKYVVLGQNGEILGFKDYYSESEGVHCIRAFLVSAVSTTVDDGLFSQGALNWTTRQGIIGRCQRSSTGPDASWSLVSTTTPGPITVWRVHLTA
jgi:hypothetical protein